MKKLTFIAIIAGICIIQIRANAQNIYAGVGVGYGFPSQIQPFFATSNSNGTSTSVTSKSYSLGTGLSVGAYGGYMFTNNIGFELNVFEKFSSSATATVTTASSLASSTDVYTAKGNLFGLTPAIRLSIGDDKLKIYTVTGLIIGFPSATLEDNGTTTTVTPPAGSITNTSDEISTYSGNLIIGFHGAVGVLYNISDKIGVFGEVTGNFENWGPSEQLVTTYTVNGADKLNGLTTSEKQINYVNSYTSSATNTSPGSPTQSSRMYLPFSSWGFNIGVHFSFGGGSATVTK
jgi:hypothetical protein